MSLRHIPYGYRIEKGTPVIVPEEAEIVSRIFHRYDDGETLLAVADSLTEQQIDYYEGKRQWNKNMIARILENRKYIGEETYPPIVSRQLFANMSSILHEVAGEGESLVLLDELGSGTDPAEGGAIACAVLKELARHKCLTMATTHLGAVKNYVHATNGMVNGAVRFDEESLQPE